jgi:cell division ATPase FtsA
MSFFNSFRWQPKPIPYSIIDIGQDTIKVAIVLMSPNSTELEFIGYGLAKTKGHDITAGRVEAESITEAVNMALTEAEDNTQKIIGYKVVPDEVLFILPSQATVEQLFVIQQTRPDMMPMSSKELKQRRGRAKQTAQQNLSELSSMKNGYWQNLEIRETGFYVDNRPVLDGVGLTGQTLSFLFWGVSVQPRLLRALETLANKLSLTISKTVPASQTLVNLIRHQEAIILDIGFAGTGICLVQSGVLTATHWVPYGGEFFTQSLVHAADMKPHVANALKIDFANGKLPQREVDWLNRCFNGARQQWYEVVMTTLCDLSPDVPLPRQIYLTGGSSQMPGLSNLLRLNHTSFDGAPELMNLANRSLPNIKNRVGAIDYRLFSSILGVAVGIMN